MYTSVRLHGTTLQKSTTVTDTTMSTSTSVCKLLIKHVCFKELYFHNQSMESNGTKMRTVTHVWNVCSKAAFLKLWSADHKWSSGSALVVLLDWTLVQKRQKKYRELRITHCSWESQREFGNYSGPLTYELNSFPRAGRNSSWSQVKTIFPIRNNGNTYNAFRNSQRKPTRNFE